MCYHEGMKQALTELSYQAARAFGAAETALVLTTDAMDNTELTLRVDEAATAARRGFDLLSALMKAMT